MFDVEYLEQTFHTPSVCACVLRRRVCVQRTRCLKRRQVRGRRTNKKACGCVCVCLCDPPPAVRGKLPRQTDHDASSPLREGCLRGDRNLSLVALNGDGVSESPRLSVHLNPVMKEFQERGDVQNTVLGSG